MGSYCSSARHLAVVFALALLSACCTGPTLAASLSAGIGFACAVMHDGRVDCWGENQQGQTGHGSTSLVEALPVTVAGLTSVLDLSSGTGHTCAGLDTGEVRCWGRNESGALGDGSTTQRTSPVAVSTESGTLAGVAAVAAGALHSCARLADGSVACWGFNGSGQLGIGDAMDRHVATPVTGLAGVVQLAAGNFHTCARLAGGGVRCWGSNASGQLGNGSSGSSSTAPVTVTGIDDAIDLTARGDHACVVRANGEAWCWGANDERQLGSSSVPSSATPLRVTHVDDIARIAGGYLNTCAIHGAGAVRCWGENIADQSGPGSSEDLALPDAATELAIGYDHGCARLVDGSAWCWGSNAQAQLGAGIAGTDYRRTPVAVSRLDDAATVSVGEYHSCVRTVCNGVKCWGINNFGQLGDGSTRDRLTPPVDVRGTSDVTELSVGSQFGCLIANGSARCLGRNDDGQLGIGLRSDAPVTMPTAVAGLGPVQGIDSGFNHACAIVAGGTVYCWGMNSFGQLGNGSTEPSEVPVPVTGVGGATDIAVGGSHSCALVAGGAMRCWGNGYQGQLGNGETLVEYDTPVAVSGLVGAIAIDAGGGHTCALKGDGTVLCWGANSSKQLGTSEFGGEFSVPTPVQALDDVVEISAGSAHTCARLADASVRCWGENESAQLGIGTSGPDVAMPTAVIGLDEVVSVSAGQESTCAVRQSGETLCWGYSGSGLLGNGEIFRTRIPVLVLGTSPIVFADGYEG